MKVLLDSSVIAGAIKGRLPVVLKLSELKPSEVAVSVLGRMEAEAGLRRDARLQSRFGKLLKEFLGSVTVLDVNTPVAQQAAHVAAFNAAGLSAYDLLTAATALAHQLTLVTDRPAVFAEVPNLDVEVWK